MKLPSTEYESAHFPTFFSTTVFVVFLLFENLEGKKLYAVLICMSLILRNVDYYFLAYWPLCVSAGPLIDLEEIFVYEAEVQSELLSPDLICLLLCLPLLASSVELGEEQFSLSPERLLIGEILRRWKTRDSEIPGFLIFLFWRAFPSNPPFLAATVERLQCSSAARITESHLRSGCDLSGSLGSHPGISSLELC